MPLNTANSPWFRKTITVFAIGGGFAGIVSTLKIAFGSTTWPISGWLIFASAVILYAYGIFVGLKVNDGKIADKHVVIYFCLQLPLISSPLLLYRFTSGFQAAVGIVGKRFMWTVGVGSEWKFALLEPYPLGIAINLFPLAILFLLSVERSYGRRA
jgi:hypothetical protein